MDRTFSTLDIWNAAQVTHICFYFDFFESRWVQDVENTGFSFTVKQLKPLLHPSLFASNKICLEMRVEALPFCLLTFHFITSDTSRTKAKAETPQTISSTTLLSATIKDRGTMEKDWEVNYLLVSENCRLYLKKKKRKKMQWPFSSLNTNQCDVLGRVNSTNRQANVSTHCSQWHHVAVTQKYHIFRWLCRCTGPSDLNGPFREPADFYFVLWRFLPRPSSTQTPHWTQWGCGRTWEWLIHPPLRLIQCCW